MPHRRFVLITGASTGIGRTTTMVLARRGFEPIACVRRADDARSIEQEARTAGVVVHTVRLDVTDEAGIVAAHTAVGAIVGADGLFGVVNNAGIVVPSPVERLSLTEWRRQFEVNFFGQISVTRTFLPLLRMAATVHGTARLVFMSSIAGTLAQPILAPYCASKHAMQALAGSLRIELRRQRIQVTLIQPGAIRTPIWAKSKAIAEEAMADLPPDPLYQSEIDAMLAATIKAERSAIAPETVAEAVRHALTARRAPTHRYVGRDAKSAALLMRWLPARWFDWLLVKVLGIAKS